LEAQSGPPLVANAIPALLDDLQHGSSDLVEFVVPLVVIARAALVA